MKCRTILLFDLDGTLLDTAPDFAYVINCLLESYQRQPIAATSIRAVVSRGAEGMLQRAFNIDKTHPDFSALQQQFLTLYSQNLARHTRPFPGIIDMLTSIADQGLPWGIVTNKPGWLTQPLLTNYNLLPQTPYVISGDTVARCKPHPDPLLHACQLIGCLPDECVFVGDAEQDIVAGKAAGMKTVAALYGYISEEEQPHAWGADGNVQLAEEILPWVENN